MSAAEKFRLFDFRGDEGPDEGRFYLQMLDARGRLVRAVDITDDEWRFEAKRGRLFTMLRGYRKTLRERAARASERRPSQRGLFSAPLAALALLLLFALPAIAEVGIVPGQSPAIPSARFAWCGRIPTASGWTAKPLTIDLTASGGDWVAAQIAAAERAGAPAGVIPVAGVIGAELRQSLKGWADELCRAGKLGSWQAPGTWSCSATSIETEIMGGFPASCAGVNPVRSLWMGLYGPSVPERAIRSDRPYEPCGLRKVSTIFGDQEWQQNDSPLCGKTRPDTVLAPPYFAGPLPEEVRTRPGAQRITSRPASWPPGACYYDSRGGFGSGVILWVDTPACLGAVTPPVDPPVEPPVDPPVDPVDPPVEPPATSCDLGEVELRLSALESEEETRHAAIILGLGTLESTTRELHREALRVTLDRLLLLLNLLRQEIQAVGAQCAEVGKQCKEVSP